MANASPCGWCVVATRRAAIIKHHGKLPCKATHTGELQLGMGSVECAVLEDGTRLLSQRGVARAFGAGVPSGSRREDKLPAFLSSKNLKPFITQELLSKTEHVEYITPHGVLAHGVRAEAIPEICEVWLTAKDAGALYPRQMHLAEAAYLIVRGLSRVGIIALIDEATGFQYDRPRRELQEYLRRFLSESLVKWVNGFPPDYFKHLCRLRGVELRPDMRLPKYFGHLTSVFGGRRG